MAKDRDYIGKPDNNPPPNGLCITHGPFVGFKCRQCIVKSSKYVDVGGGKYQIEKTDAFKFDTDKMSEQDMQDILHGPRPRWENELSARANALHTMNQADATRTRERLKAAALFFILLVFAVSVGSWLRYNRDIVLPALGCENVLLANAPARNLWECR